MRNLVNKITYTKSHTLMMTTTEIMEELESYSDENTKKTFIRHGAKEPLFGVKVSDLKKILKKTKKNHALSLELYDTGNSDAMYLAGLMADEKKISRENLNHWIEKAYWYYLSEFAVPWVAAETDFGFELGLQWIQSKKEGIASGGWATLGNYAGVKPDEKLPIEEYKKLLLKAKDEVHRAQNRVSYTMNTFVIHVGSFIKELNPMALEIAEEIGKVEVMMGNTACQVPLAKEYILKVMARNGMGKKRKTARC